MKRHIPEVAFLDERYSHGPYDLHLSYDLHLMHLRFRFFVYGEDETLVLGSLQNLVPDACLIDGDVSVRHSALVLRRLLPSRQDGCSRWSHRPYPHGGQPSSLSCPCIWHWCRSLTKPLLSKWPSVGCSKFT